MRNEDKYLWAPSSKTDERNTSSEEKPQLGSSDEEEAIAAQAQAQASSQPNSHDHIPTKFQNDSSDERYSDDDEDNQSVEINFSHIHSNVPSPLWPTDGLHDGLGPVTQPTSSRAASEGINRTAATTRRRVAFGSLDSGATRNLDSQGASIEPVETHRENLSVTENDDTEVGDALRSAEERLRRQGLGGFRTSLDKSGSFVQRKNSRLSLSVDMETGKEGGTRAHQAKIRKEALGVPQSAACRRRRGVKKILDKGSNAISTILRGVVEEKDETEPVGELPTHGRLTVQTNQVVVDELHNIDESDMEEGNGEIHIETHTETQYRLRATQDTSHFRGRYSTRWGCLPIAVGVYEETTAANQYRRCGLNPNVLVIKYLNWAFRSSFIAVFCSGAFAFFTLTVLFAGLILLSGRNKPSCIHVNGVDFGTTGANFMDAYALSWTTFSTVGYGLVFPATSATHENIITCTGITVLTTLESFVGILYASVCGAILFAKVIRIASFAQVTFSDPILIRYGSGLALNDEDDRSSNGGGGDEAKGSSETVLSNMPCPILEFRVVNRLHGIARGEIIDASMNIVATIDEKQSFFAGKAGGARRKGKKGKRRGPRRTGSKKTGNNRESISASGFRKLAKAQESVRALISHASSRRRLHFDEDPTGKFVKPRVFAKLEFDPENHPFFKRVWITRHVLDHHSPLLKPEARELVKQNGGHWPDVLNNAAAVREVIQFDQILVSLSGTSNVDANSVYAQKVYDYVDLCVGYRFAGLLFREADGSLGVDKTLLNDVTEQAGGGGELLHERNCNDDDFSSWL